MNYVIAATAATDGTSFLVTLSDGGSLGYIVPIAADGTEGTPLSGPGVGPLVWGGDRYMLAVPGSTLERLASSGTLLGAAEPLPSLATSGTPGVGWDGRAFLLFQQGAAAELPRAPPRRTSPSSRSSRPRRTVGVVSAVPDAALAVGAETQGGMGVPRAVATVVHTTAEPDAGVNAGAPDAASSDGGPDAGAGTDAGPLDAGPGTPDGAVVAPDGAVVAPDGSAADVGDDAGTPAASGSSDRGGCGCTAAGSSDASPLAALMALAAALVAVGRRLSPRRRAVSRADE